MGVCRSYSKCGSSALPQGNPEHPLLQSGFRWNLNNRDDALLDASESQVLRLQPLEDTLDLTGCHSFVDARPEHAHLFVRQTCSPPRARRGNGEADHSKAADREGGQPHFVHGRLRHTSWQFRPFRPAHLPQALACRSFGSSSKVKPGGGQPVTTISSEIPDKAREVRSSGPCARAIALTRRASAAQTAPRPAPTRGAPGCRERCSARAAPLSR